MESLVRHMCERYFGTRALFIEPGIKTGMPVHYDNPAEVGADRIVNAVAAYEKCKQSCVVVDFGTATTFDAVSARGEYMGGVIAPGISISAEALFARTARLPRVDIKRPPHVIGSNTVHSLQSGLFHGYVGLVDGILERLLAELGPARVIATGAMAHFIAGGSRFLSEIDDALTLTGLRIIWERNLHSRRE
jgi:type III pantothenate kinase